jgi:hypothetical protein
LRAGSETSTLFPRFILSLLVNKNLIIFHYIGPSEKNIPTK